MAQNYTKSIVKIFNEGKIYNYRNIGGSPSISSSSGTGFVVEFDKDLLQKFGFDGSRPVPQGKYIVTCAHCVSDSSSLWLSLDGRNERHAAKVKWIAHECDIAILELSDSESLDLEALKFGEFPNVQDKIAAVGYPTGGKWLSVTEGIVSRIESGELSHSGVSFPEIQISAGINPGNSGGPIITFAEDDVEKQQPLVIGAVHQSLVFGDNIAYSVPVNIILHVMADICRNGEYLGFPGIAISTKQLNNILQRQHYGLDKEDSGVRVSNIPTISAAYDKLKVNDILTKVNINGTEYSINNDGTVIMHGNKVFELQHAIFLAHIGDTIEFEIIRDNEKLTVPITLDKKITSYEFAGEELFDKEPPFIYVDGARFTALSRRYVRYHQFHSEDPNLLRMGYMAFSGSFKEKPTDEIVILDTVLGTEGTRGYEGQIEQSIVTQANGRKINNLNEFKQALDSNPNPTHIIKTASNDEIILKNHNPAELKKILWNFGIHRCRDDDFKQYADIEEHLSSRLTG